MNQWMIDFISGSIAGMVSTVLGHPLDTIKVRLQLDSKTYGNSFNSIMRIVKNEGVFGLFKGVIPPTMNQLTINAL